MLDTLLLIVAFLYVCLMTVLVIGYHKVGVFSREKVLPKTTFSMVIPFRNEAENLPKLLKALFKETYPKELYEILFINDSSEDNSVKIIEDFISREKLNHWRVLESQRKSSSPKKDAITTAVLMSKTDWILTTDADCYMGENRLFAFDAFIQKTNPVLVAAPVVFVPKNKNSLLEQLQIQEALSLATVTVAGFGLKMPFICNGANLAYQKKAFLETDGFLGNDSIGSGDDVFLLQKFHKKFPQKTGFLKSFEAIVYTQTESSFKKTIQQRVRWASKTTAYKTVFPKLVGILVFMMNLSVLASVFLLPEWRWFLGVFMLKLFIDATLMLQSADFLKVRFYFLFFLINSFFYPFYMLIIFCNSIFGKYEWKGRRFKK